MSPARSKPGATLIACLLAVASACALGASISACGGDDTNPSFIGVNDASPPRLGPPNDGGTE
jgi:hypothetical protein